MPLVGRERPAATLKAEIDRTLRSHGGVVFVTGEAGIGKTVLVSEAVEQAREHGARVASGTCWDRQGAPGYWPWVQVLRSLQRDTDGDVWQSAREAAGSELAQLLGEAIEGRAPVAGPLDESFGLQDAVTTLLVTISRSVPLVLVLDDLHWADVASVHLLDFVARHAWFEQLLVVGTYRDVEVEAADHPLASLLLPVVAKATSITLTGLDRAEVGLVLAETAGRRPTEEMVAEVHHRTGGNPFFVDQTARLWGTGNSVDVVAPGVRDAVERRLGLLPEPVRDLLTTASVLGPEAEREVLGAAAGLADRELSDRLAVAITARLMVPRDGSRVAFVHDIVRETLYERLDATGARRRHAAVVRVVEERPGTRLCGGTAELAHHAVLAVPDVPAHEAVSLLRTAADDAWSRLAIDEAHSHLERAYELASQEDRPEQWVRVALQLGAARCHIGESSAGRQIFMEVADLARRIDDAALLTRAALMFRGAVWLVTSPEDLHQASSLVYEAYVALVGEEGAAGKSELERERVLSTRAVELARASGDDEALVDALAAHYDASWEPGTAAERAVLAEEMAAVCLRRGDRSGALFSTMMREMDLLEQGDPRCLEEHRRFVETAKSMNSSFAVTVASWAQATFAVLAGRFEDARTFLDEAEAGEAARQGNREQPNDMAALFVQGRWTIALQQGDLDTAAGLLLTPEAQVHPYPELLEAITAVHREDLDPALRYYHKIASGEPLLRWFRPLWLRLQAQLAAATGDPELCRRAREDLTPVAGQWLVMLCAGTDGPAAFWAAAVDAAEQRWDDAVDGFTAAVEAADRLGARPWSAEARLHLAETLLGRGSAEDSGRVAQLLEEAARWAGEVGNRHLADRARLLSASGSAERHQKSRSALPEASPGEGQEDGAGGAEVNVFRFDGQVWTLGFGGRTVHVPDAKGLRDIHALLGRPRAEVAAVDLLAPAGGEIVRATRKLGGDPVLDEKAKVAYRKRLTQLDEEIDRAVLRGRDHKASELDEERAALIEEIRRATGLGGRSRRQGDEAERARKAVSERIRDTMRRLDQRHPQLAEHLRASISTGSRCGYHPTDDVPWSL